MWSYHLLRLREKLVELACLSDSGDDHRFASDVHDDEPVLVVALRVYGHILITWKPVSERVERNARRFLTDLLRVVFRRRSKCHVYPHSGRTSYACRTQFRGLQVRVTLEPGDPLVDVLGRGNLFLFAWIARVENMAGFGEDEVTPFPIEVYLVGHFIGDLPFLAEPNRERGFEFDGRDRSVGHDSAFEFRSLLR